MRKFYCQLKKIVHKMPKYNWEINLNTHWHMKVINVAENINKI